MLLPHHRELAQSSSTHAATKHPHQHRSSWGTLPGSHLFQFTVFKHQINLIYRRKAFLPSVFDPTLSRGMWESEGCLCLSHPRLLQRWWCQSCLDSFVSVLRRGDAACSPLNVTGPCRAGRRKPCSCHWPEPVWLKAPGEQTQWMQKCQFELFFWLSCFCPYVLHVRARLPAQLALLG